MSQGWIVVASADHVARGRAGGFMQVAHGKEAPLRRIRPGDRIACYSPAAELGGKAVLQAFTALGIVREGEPYRHDRCDGFQPFRRDGTWLDAYEAPIRPLLASLDLTAGTSSWGYRLRFGLVPITDHDLRRIAEAMRAELPA